MSAISVALLKNDTPIIAVCYNPYLKEMYTAIKGCGAFWYFELKLMPWDYAAGSLIVQEAGGKITTISGKKIQYNDSSSIIASNKVEDYIKYIEGDCICE